MATLTTVEQQIQNSLDHLEQQDTDTQRAYYLAYFFQNWTSRQLTPQQLQHLEYILSWMGSFIHDQYCDWTDADNI